MGKFLAAAFMILSSTMALASYSDPVEGHVAMILDPSSSAPDARDMRIDDRLAKEIYLNLSVPEVHKNNSEVFRGEVYYKVARGISCRRNVVDNQEFYECGIKLNGKGVVAGKTGELSALGSSK